MFENNRIIFYGNFPSPGPTRGDLEDLLGRGGATLLTIPNVIDTINKSLDGGLKVDRIKYPFEKSQVFFNFNLTLFFFLLLLLYNYFKFIR